MSNVKKMSTLNVEELVVVYTMPLFCFNKAVEVCKEVARRTNILAFWKIDENNKVINIYSKKEDENEAKKIINQFENEYKLLQNEIRLYIISIKIVILKLGD